MLITIILVLSLSIAVLAIAIIIIVRRATYLPKKEKDFITYVIDIYIDYADELNVSSLEEHEKIVNELKKIKKRMNDG